MSGDGGGIPFRFACQRSGHCCSGKNGYVWLADGESEEMARSLGMEVAAFERDHVRTAPDPRSGELRRSLTEAADGRCSLLEGRNECRVYAARPSHCSQFPYWDSILTDPQAFEVARATCPGIAVDAPEEVRDEAFAELEGVYRELDEQVAALSPRCEMSGLCCRFEEMGHELFATGLEADYAVHRHPQGEEPEAPGRCPYHVKGLCTAREGRPLGCRTYFCDEKTTEELADVHEVYLARIRALSERVGYPAAYGRFPAMLAARGVGHPEEGG